MAKRNVEKPLTSVQVLERIAGTAYDMEVHIADAIAIARTAQQRCLDDEDADCVEALSLVWYRLEQIEQGHAHIAKLAPYPFRDRKAASTQLTQPAARQK